MPCSRALPGRGTPPALVGVVGVAVVANHGLNLLERAPVDVGRILVLVTDFPFVDGQWLLGTLVRGTGSRHSPRAAVDEGPRIGRVLQDAEDGWDRGLAPDHVAEAVLAREQQIVIVEDTHDLARRPDLEEGREDQTEPTLHLLVGMLEHASQRIPHQPDRQSQGQFTALGLVEQPGGQTGFQGVQLQLRDQALQTKNEPTIGSSRIVNAVLVADEAGAEAAQIEELIPVGAVASQASDVVGEDDADPLLVDESYEFLKALPPLGRSARASQIGVDDPDLAGIPAGRTGTRLKVILEFETLLIQESLVGTGLADVDNGQATEVNRLNGVGDAHGGRP
jgi:hypothetical protein